MRNQSDRRLIEHTNLTNPTNRFFQRDRSVPLAIVMALVQVRQRVLADVLAAAIGAISS